MNYFDKHLFAPIQLIEPPSGPLGMIITIPCFNEADLTGVLNSLEACIKPAAGAEVIIHVNSAEHAPAEILEQNLKTIRQFNDWNRGKSLRYFLIYSPALPEKHAGVGLARKIAMDEAAWRLSKFATANGNTSGEKGIIVCLDADCRVESNYLTEIERHFKMNPDLTGCSIFFEHPLEGNEFPASIYDSIINYELFLRYYILSLKWAGFPYPYHTIGSSMAVRCDAYMKTGGMNRRQAGEDFYFLHKLFPFGKFTHIKSTRVIPSPRISDRVPFGTGAAVSKLIDGENENYAVCNFKSFRDLKMFFSLVPVLYHQVKYSEEKIPLSILKFLEYENLKEKVQEIRSHTSGEAAFVKRFFTYFDGFKTLKYVHYARDNYYPDENVQAMVKEFLRTLGFAAIPDDKAELLLKLRAIEKEN